MMGVSASGRARSLRSKREPLTEEPLDFRKSRSAPRSTMPADLPAPKPSNDIQDLSVSRIYVDDLPAPKGEVDLPAPRVQAPVKPMRAHRCKRSLRRRCSSAISICRRRRPCRRSPPATRAPTFGDLDLPAPKVSGADLPALKGRVADLPALKGVADLPATKTVADLPTPKGVADLPTPKGIADLPTAKGMADLPQARGIADLPTRKGEENLPSPKAGGTSFGDIDLPAPKRGGRFRRPRSAAAERHAGHVARRCRREQLRRSRSRFARLAAGRDRSAEAAVTVSATSSCRRPSPRPD